MSAPVRKGTKQPALLAPVKAPEASGEPVYLVGTKPIRHQGRIWQPGEIVPDAASWQRLEAKLRARTLVRQ